MLSVQKLNTSGLFGSVNAECFLWGSPKDFNPRDPQTVFAYSQ